MSRAAATLLMHRRLGMAKSRRRIPRQVYPKLIEMEYAGAILGIVRRARPAFAPLLHELPSLLGRVVDERQRADVGESKRARELVDAARAEMARSMHTNLLEHVAGQFAYRTQYYNKTQLARQTRAALGVDVVASDAKVPALVEHFVQENVALIQAIPEEIATGIERLVSRAFAAGTPHPELAEHLEERFAIGERHARLVARDQVGKLSGAVNAARQRSLGITQFVWRTVGDERVRSEHEDLDGETFDYDDPPEDGLPGEAVCCRCSAEPVFDDILGEADDDASTDDDSKDSDASEADNDAE